MVDQLLNVIGLPPELGFGLIDLIMFITAIGSGLWVYGSTDTHGYITPGYRVPFRALPDSAKNKVYFSLSAFVVFFALMGYRLA